MSDPQYAIWSIWSQLSVLYHFFFLILSAVSAYGLFSATMTIVRLRSNDTSAQRSAMLYLHWANTDRLIGAMFWFFGVVFFWGLQDLPHYLGHGGSDLVGIQLIGSFMLHFAFAWNVFVVFLVLHLVRWFVSSRLNSCTLHSEDRRFA